MRGMMKYALYWLLLTLTVFLGSPSCRIRAAGDIHVKSVQLRPEKDVYLNEDVIFFCEVSFTDLLGLHWEPSCPLRVRYIKRGTILHETLFPEKNVKLIYLDKPDSVEVICYVEGKSTPPKVIKYRGIKTPPSFNLVPDKPSYHIGDRITSCQVSQESQEKEVDRPFYMEVIDSITKQVLWDTGSFVMTAEIPWKMREVSSVLQVTCKGVEVDVGPKLIEVKTADILLAKPPSHSVVNDGDVAMCFGALYKKVKNITWVYLSGERQKVVGKEMHIRAGKLPSTVSTPATATYACIGYANRKLVYIIVTYEIASLLSLRIVPESETYAVGQRVGCDYRSSLEESGSTDFELIHGILACVRLVYTDGRPKEERCEKLMTTIPEAHSSLRDYVLICSKHNLESPPIPLRILYDRVTHLLPDKTIFLPDESILCDAKQYDDHFTPLYIAKVTVGPEFPVHESTLHISEVLRRFPAIWYNMTNVMPSDEFRSDLQVMIAFCETGGTFTHPLYITRGRSEDLKIQQIFPTFLAHPRQDLYALPETSFKCSYDSVNAEIEWKCLNCHPNDHQIVENDLLTIRQPPFDKRIEYVCIAKTSKIATNNPQKVLQIIVIANFYIVAGSKKIFELTGIAAHCQARGKSSLTKAKFSIELDAVLFTYNSSDSTWKIVGSGEEAYVQDDFVKHYAECIYSKRRRTAKKLFHAYSGDMSIKDGSGGAIQGGENRIGTSDAAPSMPDYAIPGTRFVGTALVRKTSSAPVTKYSVRSVLLYQPNDWKDIGDLEYDEGFGVIAPEWFNYNGRIMHFKDAKVTHRGIIYGTIRMTKRSNRLRCLGKEAFRVIPSTKPVFRVGDYLFCESKTNCVSDKHKLWISEPRTEEPISDNFTVATTSPPLLLRQDMTGFFKAACTHATATTVRGADQKTIILPTPPYDLQIQGATEQIEGARVISCSAKGYPVPIIQWIQLGGPSKLLIDHRGRLFIQSWDVAGSYTCLCRASNSEGRIQTSVSFKIQNAFWFRMENTKEFVWAIQAGLVTFGLSTLLTLPFFRWGNLRWC
uniref:Ig-like domain-containing protein n=2 Tax=Schistocephalus solidus TaxID=70667 RepID=A0A0X3PGW2_SCHSO